MNFRNILFYLFLGIVFFSCVSQNRYTRNNDGVVFYTLSKDETLTAFIENQNQMNEYAMYENVPTDKDVRERFVLFEKFIKKFFESSSLGLSEEDVNKLELSEEDIKNINEGAKLFSELGLSEEATKKLEKLFKLNFLYTICYDKNNRVWDIELIGRSTTLYLKYSSNRDYAYKNNLRYYNNLIPYIIKWMDLNNISSLESSYRVNINDDLDEGIVEFYGTDIREGFDLDKYIEGHPAPVGRDLTNDL